MHHRPVRLGEKHLPALHERPRETVSEGEVVVNGFAAHDRTTDLNKMRESVGMVFQRFNLFPHMTVLENLIMAPMNLRNMPRQQAVDWRKPCWRRWA